MKKYLFVLIALGFVYVGYGQFERQWSSALFTDHHYTDVNSVALVDENLVFNQVSYDEDYEVVLNELKIYETLVGNKLWSFNWSDHFPLHSEIKVLPINETQMYFVVNNSHANGMDHYGVINLFGEIVWQKNLYMSSLTNVVILNDNLLIDFSKYEEINELLMVDKEGNEIWILEDGNYKSWNNLISNRSDKAIWLNNNGLSLIDLSSQTLAQDSVSNYNRYYSDFEVLQNEVISLSWDPYNFIVKKYSNNFQNYKIDTLGYAFNIFGIPHPTIISDANGDTFISSDFTYEGDSFITKYDNDLEKQWTNDSEAEIVNIFPDGDEIIVIDAKAINVLDNVTGALLFNTVFDVDERVLNVKTKNEIADLENKSLYVFTFLDGESYLNQFKQNTTSVMNTEEDEILSVYPIPVSDRLYFENLKTFKMSYIYDANGRLVLSSGITTDYIITESLPKGTYVLQLVNPSHSITRKFIKM